MCLNSLCRLDLDPTRAQVELRRLTREAVADTLPSFPKFHTKWSLDTIYASAVSAAASVLVSRLKSAKMGAPSSLERRKPARAPALGFPATASVISPSFEGFIAV